MKRNVSVVRVIVATQSRNILISCKIIKEMPGSLASGTFCILLLYYRLLAFCCKYWLDDDPLRSKLVANSSITIKYIPGC